MKWDKKKIINALKELENKLKRRPAKKDSSNLYHLSRKYFGSWNNLLKEAGYKIREIQRPTIHKSERDKLYYLLGLLNTDGHIQFQKEGGKYRILFFTSELEEKEIILKLIKQLFEYNASVRAKKTGFSKRLNYEIYISSKEICEFLHDLGMPYGAKSKTIRMPKSLIENRRDIWNYMRGVFDGDGSIIFTKYGCLFKISGGSEKFIQDIYEVFKKDMPSARVTHEREDIWELKITNKEDILKLYNLIYKNADYFYPRKKIKWQSNMFKNT